MTELNTTSAKFFENKYRIDADPWNFQTNRYELDRYQNIMRTLSGQRFRRAFEPGCSVGVLTEQLATIADSVQACDFSETAALTAAARCAHQKNVTVACAALHADEPWDRYDLIVLSEIGYYFTPLEWDKLIERMTSVSLPGTTLLAAHWLGESPDHITSGDEVHEALRQCSRLEQLSTDRCDGHSGGYRLDVWRRKA
jgi:cyclopropane fatty-acyl-phospholipid synthase-like methyltransferase